MSSKRFIHYVCDRCKATVEVEQVGDWPRPPKWSRADDKDFCAECTAAYKEFLTPHVQRKEKR